MLKVPKFSVVKTDKLTVVNFRWFSTGFDFARFNSGSIFIQYGKKPIKYFCYITPTSLTKDFAFLSRRTSKNWVPRRDFKIFSRKIKTGITATPLKIAVGLEKKGSQECYHSHNSQTKLEAQQSHFSKPSKLLEG